MTVPFSAPRTPSAGPASAGPQLVGCRAPARRFRLRAPVLALLYLGTLAVVGLGAWRGRDYYRLPLLERPRHALHWELKPGGELGRAYGVAGATLMLAMLSYSVRKRLPLLRRAGGLGGWLDFHIWCGVSGPLLIVLHSAGKVGGVIAIAFWSMVAVALSGILGRFLYAQIPRTAAGDQLSLDQAHRRSADLGERLRQELGLAGPELAAVAGETPTATSLGAALLGLAWAPFALRVRFRRLRRRHPAVPARSWAALAALAVERGLLERRLLLWRHLHELFHYWHVFHKPFALLMYLFAAIHVGVAWATGYAVGS